MNLGSSALVLLNGLCSFNLAFLTNVLLDPAKNIREQDDAHTLYSCTIVSHLCFFTYRPILAALFTVPPLLSNTKRFGLIPKSSKYSTVDIKTY